MFNRKEEYEPNEFGMLPKKDSENTNGGYGFARGFIVGIVTALIIGSAIFVVGKIKNPQQNSQLPETAGISNSQFMAKFMSKAESIKTIIDTYYYYDEDEDKMADGMYKGMLEALGDPYTVYYTKEEYKEVKESSEGSYSGIGVVVSQDPETKVITVVMPYKNCPGYEAGMQPGDILTGADDVDFTDLDISTAVSYIKGKDNTKVVVHCLRDNQPIDFEVTRKVIEIPSVEYTLKEDNIAYIQITSFDEATKEQFDKGLEQAEKDGCKGYVFDLRDNGGGLYDTACYLLDKLLPEGTIVSTKDKYGNKSKETSDAECLGKPMAVLINGNSASASEIFAGAIQDYGVGKLFGTTSFGKGIVQTILPLGDGTAVKITTSSYFTPSGRCIHGEGITPDVTIELPEDDESYENGYLKPEYDTQLKAAIDYLKGEIK